MSVKRKPNSLFSILTSARMAAPYVDDWGHSIMKQRYRPLEVCIFNDNSYDKTEKKLEKWERRFKRNGIGYHYRKKMKKLNVASYGCAYGYRRAFNMSSGKFLGVLDVDDMLRLDAVEYIMYLYNSFPDIDWIWTQYRRLNNNSGKKTMKMGRNKITAPGKTLLKSEKSKYARHCYSHWRTFTRMTEVGNIFDGNYFKAIDKAMGYHLEEKGRGMFADRWCYTYRSPSAKALYIPITQRGGQVRVWRHMRKEFKARRSAQKTKIYPIIECPEEFLTYNGER